MAPAAPFRVDLEGPVLEVAISGWAGLPYGAWLSARGEVHCWGIALLRRPDGSTYVPKAAPLPGPATSIAALGGRVCALLEGGQVACWGPLRRNRGVWAATDFEPVVVSTERGSLTGIVRLEVGAAIDREGRLWLFDDSLMEGRERVDGRAEQVPDLPPLVDVATTGAGICVLTAQGTVLCWGQMPPWRLEDDPIEEAGHWPHPAPPQLPWIRAIACSTDGRCVFVSDKHRIYTWGGSADEPHAVPHLEPALRADPESFAVNNGVCMVEGGEVYCWRQGLAGAVATPRQSNVLYWIPLPGPADPTFEDGSPCGD